jgi:hypothetical protein
MFIVIIVIIIGLSGKNIASIDKVSSKERTFLAKTLSPLRTFP